MTKLALVSAGIIFFAPALAYASQPAQTAPSAPTAPAPAAAAPSAAAPAKADDPASPESTPMAKNAGHASATCVSSEARTEHPSAQVGKDTGVLPPKRKRPACTSQPEQ